VYSTCCESCRRQQRSTLRQHTSAYASIRQHTYIAPAAGHVVASNDRLCVSIRQHTPAYTSIRQHTYMAPGAGHVVASNDRLCVSMCQHTSAYASIHQHTSAYVYSTWCGSCLRQQGSTLRACSDADCPSPLYTRQLTSAYVSIRS
jgi:hypothetical protein